VVEVADRLDGRVMGSKGLIRLSLGHIKDSIVARALRAIEDYLGDLSSRVNTLETRPSSSVGLFT
jgi:hypothetical protein